MSVLIAHPSDSVTSFEYLVVLGVANTPHRRVLGSVEEIEGFEGSKGGTPWSGYTFKASRIVERILANFFCFYHSRAESRKGTFRGDISWEGLFRRRRDKEGHENDFFVLLFSLALFSFAFFFLEWMIWLTFLHVYAAHGIDETNMELMLRNPLFFALDFFFGF